MAGAACFTHRQTAIGAQNLAFVDKVLGGESSKEFPTTLGTLKVEKGERDILLQLTPPEGGACSYTKISRATGHITARWSAKENGSQDPSEASFGGLRAIVAFNEVSNGLMTTKTPVAA